jgi:endonuclease/exonuclease/phosphatase family metal-dependent hydrolase
MSRPFRFVRFPSVFAGVAGVAGVASVACAHLPVSGSEIPLRVMTYNIRSGNGNLAGTAEAIRAQSPDVVALQEVDVHWAERSNFLDQASALGETLRMQVRFARIYQLTGTQPGDAPREFGVALLSRFPIVDWDNHIITRLSTQEENPKPSPAPGFLEAKLDIRGKAVRVFDTHLDYRADPRVRQQQVTDMLAYIGDVSAPTLLFGDLNAPPDAPEIQPLLERLRDACDSAGFSIVISIGVTAATTPIVTPVAAPDLTTLIPTSASAIRWSLSSSSTAALTSISGTTIAAP